MSQSSKQLQWADVYWAIHIKHTRKRMDFVQVVDIGATSRRPYWMEEAELRCNPGTRIVVSDLDRARPKRTILVNNPISNNNFYNPFTEPSVDDFAHFVNTHIQIDIKQFNKDTIELCNRVIANALKNKGQK